MTGKDITIRTADGSFGGYLASPSAGRGAGIVVIQEIFGVNGFVRAVADGFAAHGYFALAPDLFWRIEPGVQLSDKTDAEWSRAFELMGKFNADLGVKDIQAAIAELRNTPGCSGKVGAVGYCLGGLLAYLTAARTDADASVAYYGVNIQKMLGEAGSIRKPLMLHIAGKDEYVPSAAQKAIVDGLKTCPHVTIHLYPEMDHAFARTGGAHYDRANAELANGRTSTFLRQHLS
ncbi:MAG TPA: dienelactone hydrolase family protein [Rhizomicrobium sp.]|jgi:carboxymethylenebutenolidase|nr:dienelactone hydrolase family protein [Rhizomicrobium sp.]